MHQDQKAQKQLPKYDRHCLHLNPQEIQTNLDNNVPYVIRLKVPDNEDIIFTDAIRGTIKINTTEIDDQVLIKSDGIPTYHFAAAVDDHLMNITHILRGDEWISSTPKAILIYRYFGWELPVFAHLPVFLDPSGQGKMSKRKGTVSARSFLDDGYLPEALLNFLMLLGWNPGTNQEIFSLEEFVKIFSLEHVHKKQPIFDRAKLDYLNGLYLRQLSDNEYISRLQPFIPQADTQTLKALCPLIKERSSTLKSTAQMIAFLFTDIQADPKLFLSDKITPPIAKAMVQAMVTIMKQISDPKDTAKLQSQCLDSIKNNNWKTGDFFMVLRVAITGSRFTPPIIESLAFLSKEKIIARLQALEANL